MNSTVYDLIIIGGGIHGVGAAQAAAAHGYRVLLLEKDLLAHGTSSRSSKLIHGGLRYLESAQFSLVRECLRERRILLDIAPHLVHMQRFYFPIYRGATRRSWQLALGLSAYALLAGLDRHSRFGTMSPKHWDNKDGLLTTGLQRIWRYGDAVTDDRLLTQAVAKSAEEHGAHIREQCLFTGAENLDGAWHVGYESAALSQSARGTVLINAAGPWINQVRDKINPAPPQLPIDLIQGSHIMVEADIHEAYYYVEAPDKRVVFIMPKAQGQVLIGTTERPFLANPDRVEPGEDEIRYLLGVFGHYFPGYRSLTVAGVSKAFAGLRVLQRVDGSSFHRARDTVLLSDHRENPGYVAVYGGKLTAYRATAEKIIKLLERSRPAPNKANTSKLPLPR